MSKALSALILAGILLFALPALAQTGGETYSSDATLDANGKFPVPHDVAQRLADKKVHELYASEYSSLRDPVAQREFARKLLDRARDVEGDPPLLYVLLREARDLATKCGDVATAVEAISATGERFAADTLELELTNLPNLMRGLREVADLNEFLRELVRVSQHCYAADRYDEILRLLPQTEPVVRKATHPLLLSRLEYWKGQLRKAQLEHKRLLVARKKLTEAPQDPAANMQVGRFLCFIKDDWSAGLKHLAAGSDAPLKALAQRDMERPRDAKAQVALGDAWADAAGKSVADQRAALATRALHWYRSAADQLSGLEKDQAVRKMLEMHKAGADQSRPPLLNTEERDNLVLFRGKFYLYVNRAMTWDEAQAWCVERGGTLMSVGSGDEQSFLGMLIPALDESTPSVWLGGSDANGTDRWQWSDGSPFRYTNWGHRNRSDRLTKDQRLRAEGFSEYKWSVRSGDQSFPFVAQWTSAASGR